MDRRARLVVPFAVLAMAAALRLWALGSPPQPIADEVYYATDAENYLGGGVNYDPPGFATIPQENTWMHPPLGKELIALGVGPLGLRPIGWRLPSAVAGTLTVLFVYLLALRLLRSVWWAGLAALLTALDGLHVVLSRLAMLDVFVGMFLTGAFFFLVRHLVGGGTGSSQRRVDRLLGGRDLAVAGALFGGAIATKWSALFALVVGAGVVLWRRRGPALPALGALVGVPAAVYLVAYLPFWIAHGPAVGEWIELQGRMLSTQLGADAPNPLASSAWQWPLLLDGLRAFPASTGSVPSGSARILALGNPVLWWSFVATVPALAWLAIRRREIGAVLALGVYLALWAPWLAFSRNAYLYYLAPAVPFMALGLSVTLSHLAPHLRPAAARGLAALAAAAAVALAPVWLGISAPRGWTDAVLWLPGWR